MSAGITYAGVGVATACVITGCALMWHNAHGYNTSTYGARAFVAGVFDYVYMILFAILAAFGRGKGQVGLARVGLLGLAALVFTVHTTTSEQTGQGWAEANNHRLAIKDNQAYYQTLSDKDANREMLAGITLCFIASLLALVSCAFGKEERKGPSKGALVAFVLAACIIIALAITWWDSKITRSLSSARDSTADIVTYFTSMRVVASCVILIFMLAVGLFLDVPEYVGVVAFFASLSFATVLQTGFSIADILELTTEAQDERSSTRAGTALFYISCLLMMVSAAAYFGDRFSEAKERTAGVVNYLLIIAAVVCLVPGVAMLWHQAEGLARVNSNGNTDYDKNANVAEAFAYVYIVVAAIGGIVANKMGKHGMLPFFMISSCAMLFGLSVSRSLFSWANGNIFREAAQEDVTITFGDEYIKKTTLTDSSANRQAAGGFVLCQVASFLGILSLVTLSSGEKQRNVVVMALAILSIMAFVACGVFEANSNEAGFQTGNIGVTANVNFFFSGAYYETLHMVAVFFFMAFFTLLGYVLGASEFVWVLIIVSATSGLQFLYFGFKVALIVRNTAGNDKDRALAAGAIGFFFSLITILASSIAGFVGSGEKQTDDYLTIAGI